MAMDRLREIVADFETDHDPLSRAEVEAARALLRGDQVDSASRTLSCAPTSRKPSAAATLRDAVGLARH